MKIDSYLELAVENEASDLFFIVDAHIQIKIEGQLSSLGTSLLTPEMTEAIARHLMTKQQWATFQEKRELDFAYSLPETRSRFRVNAYFQRGMVSLVLRYIKSKPPSLDEMELPQILKDMILRKRGLILMTGSTGSGKSTTLAAMLEYRNERFPGHIITIEDPIEFIYEHKKSIFSQRELGLDTHSFADALRSSLREAPDVVLIGEMRDRDTMEAALTLSNTGQLAISTLHSNNAHQAIQRIINLFPADQHKRLLLDLSINLVAIVSQRLVMGVNGRRLAAVEIMVNTPYIRELIMLGKIDEIKAAMEHTTAKNIQSFDRALIQLFKEGKITLDEALDNADSAGDLEARINFTE
ncbi:MAG: PilT/PilU family type 4a pilus ATPase [Pseudomonadota bacterium]